MKARGGWTGASIEFHSRFPQVEHRSGKSGNLFVVIELTVGPRIFGSFEWMNFR